MVEDELSTPVAPTPKGDKDIPRERLDDGNYTYAIFSSGTDDSARPSQGTRRTTTIPKPKPTKLTAQHAGAGPVRVMGAAGPLRDFSETCFLGSMSYERPTRKGWAGFYVCDQCLIVRDGVYRVGDSWLCAACRSPRASALRWFDDVGDVYGAAEVTQVLDRWRDDLDRGHRHLCGHRRSGWGSFREPP
jgi:hypothetical protein